MKNLVHFLPTLALYCCVSTAQAQTDPAKWANPAAWPTLGPPKCATTT